MSNENWDKEKQMQCILDRQRLQDIHLAVCGNPELGVPGLVEVVRKHGASIKSLEETRNGGLVLSRAGSVFVGGLVAMATIGCFGVALYEALKGK